MPVPSAAGKPWEGRHWSDEGTQEWRDSLTDAEVDEWRGWQSDAEQAEQDDYWREQDARDRDYQQRIEEMAPPDPDAPAQQSSSQPPEPGVAAGPTVAFVDAAGNPLDAVVGDQPIKIEVRVPRRPGETPPQTIEVTVSGTQTTLGIEYQGTETVTLSWTGNVTGPVVYRSDFLTIEKGGGGAGAVGVGGFEVATGSMDGFAPNEGDVIQVGFGAALSGARVFSSVTKMELTFTLAAIGTMSEMYTNVLVNLNGLEQELASATNVENKAEIQAQIDQLQGTAQQGLGLCQRAIAYTNNPNLLDHQKLAVARLYGGWIGIFRDPAVVQADGSPVPFGPANAPDPRDESMLAYDASEQAKEEVKTIMWRGLGQATIGGYRLLAHATLVAQIMTLTGTTEMGKHATFLDKWGAFWDLVVQGALMGAMIKWNHDTIVGHTTARIPRTKPVGDQGTAMRAPSGTPVTPEAAGMLRQAGFDAQMVARAHDVQIQVRFTNPDAMLPRAMGAIPKPMAIKPKTIKPIDREIGAPAGALDASPGLFQPRLPARGNRTDAEWKAIVDRYNERLGEWEGPIGDYTRGLVDKGEFQLRDGMVTGKNGEIIAGDYDLFEISNLDGTPASPAVYDAVVADLMAANGFQAAHGAHMRWNPRADDPGYHIDFSSDLNGSLQGLGKWWADRGIFRNIRARHQPGGEGLITFAPNRPPVITYAGEVVAPKLAELGITVPNATVGGPNIFIQPPTLYFATTQQLLDGRIPVGDGWDWARSFNWQTEVEWWEGHATALETDGATFTERANVFDPSRFRATPGAEPAAPITTQSSGQGLNWKPLVLGGVLVLTLAGGGFVLLNQPPAGPGIAVGSPTAAAPTQTTGSVVTQPPARTNPPTRPPSQAPSDGPAVAGFAADVAALRVTELTEGILSAPRGWVVDMDAAGDTFVFGPGFPAPGSVQPWADLVGAGAFSVQLTADQASALNDLWACPPAENANLFVFCNRDIPLQEGPYLFALTAWADVTPDPFEESALCSWAIQTDADGDPTNGFDPQGLEGHPLTGSDVYFEGLWFINGAGDLQHYLLATDYRMPVRADTGDYQGNLLTAARAVRPAAEDLPINGRNFVEMAFLMPALQVSNQVYGAHGYCATDRGNMADTLAIDVLGDVSLQPGYLYDYRGP